MTSGEPAMEAEQIFKKFAEMAGRWRRDQRQGGFADYLEPGELARRLDLGREAPGDWEALLRWVESYLAHAVKTGNPGYLNRMWSEANLPSVLGEMTAALTNTSACTYETAPVSTLMEKHMIRAMLDLVGFPRGSGQMTTGSSNANLVALLVARNHACPDGKARGLFGQRPLFALVNRDAHYSFDRAANVLGLGARQLVKVATDDHGRMRIDALSAELERIRAEGGLPFFVCATAGTTVRGAFDRVEPLLALREEHGFWLHVDGAWGGPVVFSPPLRERFLPRLKEADSFTLDFHKMPGSALMCNVLLLRGERGGFREALAAGDESYIFRPGEDGAVRDLGTLSLQCGRRVDSLKWFLDWKFYGRAGFADRVERYLSLCEYAESRVQAHPMLEMVVPRESFNVCFRFRAPAGVDAAALNRAIRARLQQEGRYLVGTGFVDGELAIRLLVTNPNVDRADIDAFLNAVAETGTRILAEAG